MAYGRRGRWEPLRIVGFAAITANYAALGTATIDHTRLFSLFNTTDQDVLISLDGVTDHLRLASESGQVFDLTANKVCDDGLFVKKGTIFYIKHAGVAPLSGNVWIQVLYAEGGV